MDKVLDTLSLMIRALLTHQAPDLQADLLCFNSKPTIFLTSIDFRILAGMLKRRTVVADDGADGCKSRNYCVRLALVQSGES